MMKPGLIWMGAAGLVLAMTVSAQIAEPGKARQSPWGEDGSMPRFHQGGEQGMLLHRILQRREWAEQLGLEDEQIQTIRERLLETARQMVALRAELQQTALRQAELMAHRPVDEAAVMNVIAEMGAIRTRIDQLRAREMIFMQSALTDEQRAQAAEMVRTRMREGQKRSRPGESSPGWERRRGERDGDERDRPVRPPPHRPSEP